MLITAVTPLHLSLLLYDLALLQWFHLIMGPF